MIEYANNNIDGKIDANDIARFPKSESIPLIRGHWVWDPNGQDWNLGAWVCSRCHTKNDNIIHIPEHDPRKCVGSRWCPQCGAYMCGFPEKMEQRME